jgi:hypothetical protein
MMNVRIWSGVSRALAVGLSWNNAGPNLAARTEQLRGV